MSAKAVAWTREHSPYRNGTFAVHVALAEAADEANGYELWLTRKDVQQKARCGRHAVDIALARLVADGYLDVIEAGGGRGNPTRYRFKVPETAPKQRQKPRPKKPRPNAQTAPDAPPLTAETAPKSQPTPLTQEKELVQETRGAEAPQAALDGMPERPKSRREADPLVAEAHSLAERVFANRRNPPIARFLNVRNLAEAALRSNWTVAEVEALMLRPDTVFTKAGFETAIARASRQRPTADDTVDMLARRLARKEREAQENR